MAGISFVEVVEVGPGWNKVLASDGNVYTLKGDYNWRSNNPGNIEYGKFAVSQGAIGSGKAPKGRARGFAIFPTIEAGEKARIALQFESKAYRDKTVAQAISRWAPPFENNTQAYIDAVTKAAGVTPDTKMSDLTPQQRQAFLAAQSRVEGFKPGKIIGAEGTPVPASVVQQFKARPTVPSVPVPMAAPIPASLPVGLGANRILTPPTHGSAAPVPLPRPRPAPVLGFERNSGGVKVADLYKGILPASSPPPLPRPRPEFPSAPSPSVSGQQTFAGQDRMPQRPLPSAPAPRPVPQSFAGQDRMPPRTVTKTVMVSNPAYVAPKTAAPGAGLSEAQMRAIRGDMSMVAPKPAAPAVPQFIPQTFTAPAPQYTPPKAPPPLPQPQQNGLLGNLMGMLPKVDFGQIKDNVVNAMAPAVLGSVAGRTMIIDPAIRQAFTRQPPQPMAGQKIATANNGKQVIGQRVNNSDRGYTVSQNDWFNSVRGL